VTVYTSEHVLPVKTENIPEELKRRPQWVVWRAVGNKPDKVPCSARDGLKASSTDLLTWSTFEEAHDALRAGECSGVGFVFSSADPFTGIDLDKCVDPRTGEVAAWAMEIIRYFDSYTELSVSGTGIHIILRGLQVPNRRKGEIEVYSSKRFFAVTGHVLEV
jgi:putative DNA primase/helicase